MTVLGEDHVRAEGKLVLFIASLLARADIVSIDEFGHLLRVFAVTVGETEPAEGEILALWASAFDPEQAN